MHRALHDSPTNAQTGTGIYEIPPPLRIRAVIVPRPVRPVTPPSALRLEAGDQESAPHRKSPHDGARMASGPRFPDMPHLPQGQLAMSDSLIGQPSGSGFGPRLGRDRRVSVSRTSSEACETAGGFSAPWPRCQNACVTGEALGTCPGNRRRGKQNSERGTGGA